MEIFTIKGKKSVTANLLIGFLVMTVAVLLATSFTGMALASGRMQGDEGFFKGEVVAVDTSHRTPSITPNEAGKLSPVNPNAELNIFVTNNSNLMMCKANKPLRDIKVGDKVTVSYHELAGLAVADRISKPC